MTEKEFLKRFENVKEVLLEEFELAKPDDVDYLISQIDLMARRIVGYLYLIEGDFLEHKNLFHLGKNPLKHVATADKIQKGKWVFSRSDGWVRVHRISSDGILAGERSYTNDGKEYNIDNYPALFTYDIFEGTSPPEADWTKVPRGTGVAVANHKDDPRVIRQFYSYSPDSEFKFTCFHETSNNHTESWKLCRLAPGVHLKDEWIKER